MRRLAWNWERLARSVLLLAVALLGSACPKEAASPDTPAAGGGYIVPITVSPAAGMEPGRGAYFREEAGAATTVLYISNLGDAGENVVIEFQDAAGALADSASEHVPPGALWRLETGRRPALAGRSGTFRVSVPLSSHILAWESSGHVARGAEQKKALIQVAGRARHAGHDASARTTEIDDPPAGPWLGTPG